MTIDEFNTDDYGPKALAWYTSGFTDRSHFETVEFSLWYYGPWFQMLAALVQSLRLADAVTVRHAITFLIGIAGLATLLPIARLSVGRWAGPAALILCLITGYVVAAFAPVGFLVIQHATLYDGVRHTLFVIPMLALLAGWASARLLRSLSRTRIVFRPW
jgi:hypothetical protein